jgi:hypothetical protein
MRSWIWIFVVFLGSLPFAAALQYYLTGEPSRNTPTRNWLTVAQAVFGIAVMALGLYRQIKAAREVPEPERHDGIKLSDDQ